MSLVYWGFYISDRIRHGGRMCWTRQPLSIVSDDHMEPSMRFQALVCHGKLDKNELNIWSCQFVILNILHRWLLLFQGLWNSQEDTLMISWYDQSLTPEISAVCGKLILLKLNHDSFCTCLSTWSDVVYLIWSFICCFLPGLFDLYVKFYNLGPECDVILECGYWSKTWNMQLPRMFTVAPLP